MPETSPVQVVQLTQPGRGAVATILVEGPGALEIVDFRFRAKSGKPLKLHAADGLVFGHFGPEPGEEIVVRRRSDQSIELHCHGGHAAAAMIEKLLAEDGCRTVNWQDWAADHHQDPIAAAAHVALAEARTQRTAAILLDQYHGTLRRVLDEIEQALRNGDTASAGKQVETLLARADLGRHLTRPWQVVLAGRANVGKSSLINALVGYPRAIVHRAPGTTRDVVTANTAVDGWPIELSDTAGLHAGSDALSRAGVELAQKKLSGADLVILVFDAAVSWSDSDRAMVQARPSALVVHNKCDLPSSPEERPPGLATSALTGEGIEKLLREIAARLVPDPPPPGAAVPFTAGQIELLADCRSKLKGNRPLCRRQRGTLCRRQRGTLCQ